MRLFLLVLPKKKKLGESKKSDNNETLLSSLPPRAAALFDPFLGLSSHSQRRKTRLRFYGLIELYIKHMSGVKNGINV